MEAHAPGRPRFMRVRDAFAFMNVGYTKGYALIKARRIRAVKLDHTTLVDMDSVDALMESLPTVGEARLASTAQPV